MKRFAIFAMALLLMSAGNSFAKDYRNGIQWDEPKVVTPGKTPADAPSDAIVLFNGKDMKAWNGGPWEVKDGVMTVIPGKGAIQTKQKFGSCQVHLEFCTPPAQGEGQGRGNSGLFFMNHYEVQILDSFQNETYFDGQCASIYKQQPPYVNICKKPGEWQVYDVVFTRPIFRFTGEGANKKIAEVVRPAYVTVFHNGACVINHWEIKGDTYFDKPAYYNVHEDRESISLQDHHNRMKFRNIWVREIPDSNNTYHSTVAPYFNEEKKAEEAKAAKAAQEAQKAKKAAPAVKPAKDTKKTK